MERITLKGREITYRTFHRRVRSPRMEIENGALSLVLPLVFKGERQLIERHWKWILKQLDRFEEVRLMSETLSLRTDLPEEDFKKLAEEKTGRFCSELGVRVHSISFKKLKGRWGSCTGDGKITVNTFLRFLPDRLIDYILFHEVAHRIEKGHNRNFHAIIRRKFDDNVMLEKTLAAYWYLFSQSRFILE